MQARSQPRSYCRSQSTFSVSRSNAPSRRLVVVYGVPPRTAAEAAQPFLELDIDATNKTVTAVEVEDENPVARATRLRAVGRAQVEITLQPGVGGIERRQRVESQDE